MQLDQLLNFFDISPAASLLRSQNAPFIIDFLESQFKQSGRTLISHSELVNSLLTYQEDLRERYPNKLPSSPENYLSDWCSNETRWLRRFLEAAHDELSYELTTHTENVLIFLDRVLNKELGFVGTESRLQLVIQKLEEIVIGASDDPQTRLDHLEEEKRRIERKIEQIQLNGQVSKFHPAKIREEFQMAVSVLKQLQGDFRAVEESFRDITMQVQKQQAEGESTRGNILEFALDSEDELKKKDQGVSFNEFVKLILSPMKTTKLEQIIQGIRVIPELNQQQEGIEIVRGMITLLQQEAEKVMRTNSRLSTTLRRLLDAQAHAERHRITQLLQEIRQLAITLATDPPEKDIGIDVEVKLYIQSPFRRTFWSEPIQMESVELTDFEVNEDDRLSAFQQLASMQRLDWHLMKDRVREMTVSNQKLTLKELLELFPPKSGAIEVLGYIQIARDEGHTVSTIETEHVVIPPFNNADKWMKLKIPLVTFHQGGDSDE